MRLRIFVRVSVELAFESKAASSFRTFTHVFRQAPLACVGPCIPCLTLSFHSMRRGTLAYFHLSRIEACMCAVNGRGRITHVARGRPGPAYLGAREGRVRGGADDA